MSFFVSDAPRPLSPCALDILFWRWGSSVATVPFCFARWDWGLWNEKTPRVSQHSEHMSMFPAPCPFPLPTSQLSLPPTLPSFNPLCCSRFPLPFFTSCLLPNFSFFPSLFPLLFSIYRRLPGKGSSSLPFSQGESGEQARLDGGLWKTWAGWWPSFLQYQILDWYFISDLAQAFRDDGTAAPLLYLLSQTIQPWSQTNLHTLLLKQKYHSKLSSSNWILPDCSYEINFPHFIIFPEVSWLPS